MPDHGGRHKTRVGEWLDRTRDLSPVEFVDAFQLAFDALWERALQSLGDVTLTAIVDRVLHTTIEAFPIVAPLGIVADKLQCRALRAKAAEMARAELAEVAKFVLVQFLTVLGNLTAEILTPALHSGLSNVPVAKRRTQGGARHADSGTRRVRKS
jgi:hypothetical protein